MTLAQLSSLRLQNQWIGSDGPRTAEDVVNHLVAMQSQDFLASLWAVGLRMGTTSVTQHDVEHAIENRRIVRTWPMRGTLHLVAAEDARWLLNLLTPRVIARFKPLYKDMNLDEAIIHRSRELVIKALEGGKSILRDDLMQVLNGAGISTTHQRGYHILAMLSQEGLVCFGPRVGKQHSLVLMDDWIPGTSLYDGDEALFELTKRYFTSHGPATEQDFSAWSGLTLTEVRKSIASAKKHLVCVSMDDQEFWMSESSILPDINEECWLLPAFDEWLCGYKGRRAILQAPEMDNRSLKNGIIRPVLIVNGRVEGLWKRDIRSKQVDVSVESFIALSDAKKQRIFERASDYTRFSSELPATIRITP